MAKSLRSKAKRRLRTVRREHQWETRGKQEMQVIASRLHNPFYNLKSDFERRPNAFVEPENPAAHFPQIAKPDIMDFRSHKMAKGGLACVNTFRKANSVNAIKSKYPTIVRTLEMIADEEAYAALHKDDDMESEEEEQEVKSINSNGLKLKLYH